MKKRRISLRIENDEAIVVAPLSFWDDMETHCYYEAEMIDDPLAQEAWEDAASHIARWIEKTRDKRMDDNELE